MAVAETTMSFGADAARALAERGGDPAWLLDHRLEALDRFESLPWPDQSREEWRHTDLRRFTLEGVTPVPAAHAPASSLDDVPEEVLAAMGDVGDRAGLAVQIDADVVHCRLAKELEAKGVIFAPLGRAAAEHPDLVRSVLGTAGFSESEEKFVAMGAAFAGGGTLLYVPRGVDIALPVQTFRWLSASGNAILPRVVIVADEASSVTYIDSARGGVLEGSGLAVGTVEIYARPASQVSYLQLQDLPQTLWSFHVQRALVSRDATVRSLSATLGARFSRSVVESILDGAGAHSEMLGVYFADGDQHFAYWSLQDHRAPNTSSLLNFKGALKGRSAAVYRGLIHIRKGADRTNAHQINRNLLLSDHARADPAPFLEIEANDVICTHATSVGALDEEQRFYLESRGLSRADAERLLVKAFFQEIIDQVRIPEVREALEDAVEKELELEE
jgi:Fe-S cluster assembly protein SufD